MRKSNQILFMFLTIFALTFNVNAQMVELEVSNDSWVSEDAPDVNNDGITDLECGQMDTDSLKSREVYLKFDLPEMDEIVKSAEIEFTGAQKGDQGWVEMENFYIEILGAGNSWSEDTLTWNNKPDATSKVLAEVNVNAFGTYSISDLYVTGPSDETDNAETSSGSQVVFDPIADAYTREHPNGKDANYGESENLECKEQNGYSQNIYFKFDISSFESAVHSSTLRLYCSSTPADQITSVYDVTDSEWDETTITWNNQPAASSTASSSQNVGTSEQWYEWDLTDLIADKKASGLNIVTIMVRNNTSSKVLFNARENASNTPELIVSDVKEESDHGAPLASLTDYINLARMNGDTAVSFVVRGKEPTPGSRVWISDKSWQPVILKLEFVESDMVEVSHDTWVSEEAPDQNNDGTTDMECAWLDTDSLKIREIYLKFDISEFSGYVDNALFEFTGAQKGSEDGWIELENFYVDIYGTKNNWDETTLTWNTKPNENTGVLATVNITDFGKYVTGSSRLDNHLSQALAAGASEISFIFRASEMTNGSRIWISDKSWEPVKLHMATFDVDDNAVLQDTWVSEDDPDSNFDGETDMQIAQMDTDTLKNREAYVQFSVKDTEGYVDFASIRLTGAQKGAEEGWIERDDFIVQIFGGDNDWIESEMTWNTKAEIFNPVLAEVNINEFNTFEISTDGIRDYVNKVLTNGDTLVSFAFRGKELTNGSRAWISDKGWKGVTLSLNSFDVDELSVIEDSWVSEDEPDTNFDAETDMQVAEMDTDTLKSRQAYLKYNLKGLQTSEKFVLRFVSAQKPMSEGWNELEKLKVGLFATENDWSETEITWNLKPAPDHLLAESVVHGFAAHNYYYFDTPQLTDYVNQAIADGDTIVSFAIKGTELTNGSRVWISDMGWEPAKLLFEKQASAVIDVESVSLDVASLDLELDETATLTATVVPENATNKEVTWSSDDETVATVNDGLVTATGAGTAQIKVTTTDGNFEAVCVVNVTDPTSVGNFSEDIIKLYPNPAKDHLTIQFYDNEFNELIVQDVMGKTVKHIESAIGDEYSFGIEDLTPGLYLLSLKNSHEIYSSYFIVE